MWTVINLGLKWCLVDKIYTDASHNLRYIVWLPHRDYNFAIYPILQPHLTFVFGTLPVTKLLWNEVSSLNFVLVRVGTREGGGYMVTSGEIVMGCLDGKFFSLCYPTTRSLLKIIANFTTS